MSTKEIEKSLNVIKKSRRAHERFPYEQSVKLMINEVSVKGAMKNLSLGGAFVVFDAAVGVKDSIELYFSLPGIEEFKVNCEIAWFVPSGDKIGCGLKFKHLPQNVFDAIMELSKDKELLNL